jgi:hypothetical protein
MSCLLLRVMIASLTFAIGLSSAKLLVIYRRPVPQPTTIGVKNVPASQPAAQLVTFGDMGDVDMFMLSYPSSDGVDVRYGCFEQEFSFHDKLLEADSKRRIIERTPRLNSKGVRVGERVVWIYSDGAYTEAGVAWTEGSRVFDILAPSLWYALAFERSKVWADQGCTDFRVMDRAFPPTTLPNNSFNTLPQ